MELRYKGEAMVGTLLIVGVATFVGLLMWLQGKQWRSGDLVHVTFESVDDLFVPLFAPLAGRPPAAPAGGARPPREDAR